MLNRAVQWIRNIADRLVEVGVVQDVEELSSKGQLPGAQ
jgi:hypothetical protein